MKGPRVRLSCAGCDFSIAEEQGKTLWFYCTWYDSPKIVRRVSVEGLGVFDPCLCPFMPVIKSRNTARRGLRK